MTKEYSSYTMSSEEFNKISFALEQYHTLFYKLWSLGKPVFIDNISTAQVGFDSVGKCILFEINPEFWQSLTFTQKLFVICHEAKHVINNHGLRSIDIKDPHDRKLANTAMDICVNHDLVERFGFIRIEIYPDDDYVWVDKVAEALQLPHLADDQCYEYYYNLLKAQPKNIQDAVLSSMGTVDDHGQLPQFTEKDIRSIYDQIIEEGLSEEDAKKIASALAGNDADQMKGYGSGSLGTIFNVSTEKVKSKKKWESIIKKWAVTAFKIKEKESSQWILTNRRFALLDKSLSLPTDMSIDVLHNNKTKLKVWFFLDTSGSCIGYKNRFFKAAKTLPTERFDIKLLCFDTKVYPTTLASGKVYGGGGTSLAVMERYITANTVNKGEKYPDAVFVITDADGTPVKPLRPERWYWFLTTMRAKANVPAQSKIFDLKEFE